MDNTHSQSSHSTVKISHVEGKPLIIPNNSPVTLSGVLRRAAFDAPDKGFCFIADSGAESWVTFPELLMSAKAVLAGLQDSGVKPGEKLILQLADKYQFLQVFWGCLLGGIVPVPLSPSLIVDPSHKTFPKFITIWKLLGEPLLILDKVADVLQTALDNKDSKEAAELAKVGVNNICIKNIESITLDPYAAKQYSNGKGDELAFLQFTSGSTGNPKGVMLSHSNLINNMFMIRQGGQLTADDTVFNWMPFYHDMGLIGAHLTLVLGMNTTYQMAPFSFVKRPLIWLKKIDQHRITITSSPNFGYMRVLEKVTDEQLDALDLSCLRIIYNGAEPISIPVMNQFMDKLVHHCGLPENAMYPVYGMAEACLGVTIPPMNEKARYTAVHRATIASANEVKVVAENDRDALLFADEGFPINGMALRVVDEQDQSIPQGKVGHMQIKGPNVTSGYYQNKEATDAVMCEGWLRTGDLGFMLDDRIHVAGRSKDIIFINGQNFYAHDLEQIGTQIDGAAQLVAVGYQEKETGLEKVIVFVVMQRGHVKLTGADSKKEADQKVLLAVLQELNESFGFSPDVFVKIGTGAVSRTTSGKIQRYKMLDEYLAGHFNDKKVATEAVLGGKPESHQKKGSPLQADKPEKLSHEAMVELFKLWWSEVLRLPADRIGLDESFFELGGNSVRAVEVIGLAEDYLQCAIPQQMLKTCKTINEMIDFIIDHKVTSLGRTTPDSAGTKVNQAASESLVGAIRPPEKDVAVIGVSCRFPGARNITDFWKVLAEGKNCVTEVPEDRWKIEDFYDPLGKGNKSTSKWGGFLDDVRQFDASFFKIPEAEAQQMDPQQRLFLEVSWEALESAGYSKPSNNRIGVFAGAGFNSYIENFINIDDTVQLHESVITGNLTNMVAARVAHTFNLLGPALTVDAACSSSLVAIHLACQSILLGESDLVIAGGVQLNLNVTPYLFFSKAGALSVDGRCKAFDEGANGIVPGEGCGAVLLKSYRQALEDGDPIIAVIKGSAINNDGQSLGVMAPNPQGQVNVIEQAYRNTGISADTISFVEAHGTGTQIGDLIEVKSLSEVFNKSGVSQQSCAIGSVKSNIGHLLAASGIAGFIKTILALKYGQIPPTINVQEERKRIQFEQSPFYVNRQLNTWASKPGQPRRAAVSSFGFGGTNCHLIVEEANVPVTNKVQELTEHQYSVLTVSAHHPQAFDEALLQLRQYLEQNSNVNMNDLCYTKSALKSHFWEHRAAFVTNSAALTQLQLSEFKTDDRPARWKANKCFYQTRKSRARGIKNKTVFLFSGQGSQFPEMATDLFRHEKVFRDEILKCQDLIGDQLSYPLLDLLIRPMKQSLLNQTEITQPLIFSMNVALAKLWLSWGVEPDAVLGHSIGEYSAACIAGVLTLEDALSMVLERGRLMQSMPPTGGMGAIFAPYEQVQEVLSVVALELDYAALNGPNNVVISGEVSELEKLFDYLQSMEIGHTRLKVSHAFHSRMMAPIIDEFVQKVRKYSFHPPQIPMISNVSGDLMAAADLNGDYWGRHILQPVLFEPGIQKLKTMGYMKFLEIGAKDQLAVLTRKILDKTYWVGSSRPNPRMPGDPIEHLLYSVSELYVQGVDFDWKTFHLNKVEANVTQYLDRSILIGAESKAQVSAVDVPAYPLQRKESWVATARRLPSQKIPTTHRYQPIQDKLSGSIQQQGMGLYQVEAGSQSPVFTEHKVQDKDIVPGMAHCEFLLDAFQHANGKAANRLSKLIFQRPWHADQNAFIHLKQHGSHFTIQDEKEQVFSYGQVERAKLPVCNNLDITSIYQRCKQQFTPDKVYRLFDQAGLSYGAYFQNIITLHANANESIAQLSHPRSAHAEPPFHTGIMDASLQAVIGCLMANQAQQESIFIPMTIDNIALYHNISPAKCLVYTRLLPTKSRDIIKADVYVCGLEGEVCIVLAGFSARRIESRQKTGRKGGRPAQPQDVRHFYRKQWVNAPVIHQEKWPASTWLLFLNQDKIAESLIARMQYDGYQVIAVYTDKADFNQVDEQTYEINPYKAAHFDQLFQSLASRDQAVDGMLDVALDKAVDLNELAESTNLSRSVEAYFYLFKALSNSQYRKGRFLRITKTAKNSSLDALSLGNPLVTGFLRSIKHELSQFYIKSVEFIQGEHSEHDFVSSIVHEFNNNEAFAEIRYRRHQRKIDTVQVVAAKKLNIHALPYQADKVYWIIGGMGGVGAEVAKHLARTVAPRIVITGRTKIKKRDLANHELVKTLRELGSEVLYLNGDVSDPGAMVMQLQKIKDQWAHVHGIFQCALGLEDAFIQTKTWSSFTRVLTPRVQGTILLDSFTRDEPLDFFLLFSSLTGVIGNIGQSDYTASNIFLEHFAALRQGPGLTRAIHWGQWQTGNQVTPVVKAMLDKYKLRPIGIDEGMQAIDTLLCQDDYPHLAYVPSDAGSLETAGVLNAIRHYEGELMQPEQITAVVSVAEKVESEPAVVAEHGEKPLIGYLIGQIAQHLELDEKEVDPELNFLEMGADSMKALEMVKALESALQVELYPTLLFEYPTVRELSDYLEEITPRQNIEKVIGLQQQVAVIPKADIEPAKTEWVKPISADSKSAALEKDAMTTLLINLASTIMDIEPVDIDTATHFLEMGADSMQALNMVKQLESTLSVELYPTLLFEYSNIEELAVYCRELAPDYGKSEEVAVASIPVKEAVTAASITENHLIKEKKIETKQVNPVQMPTTQAVVSQQQSINDNLVDKIVQQQQRMMDQFFDQQQKSQQAFFDHQQTLFRDLLSATQQDLPSIPREQPKAIEKAVAPAKPEVKTPSLPKTPDVEQKTSVSPDNRLGFEALLTQIAIEKLEFEAEDIDPDMNFLEMGADSMQALNMVKALEKEIGTELYPTLLFEYPSIHALAEYLREIVPDYEAQVVPQKTIQPTVQPTVQATVQSNRVETQASTLEPSIETSLESRLVILAAEKMEMAIEDLDPDMNFLEMGADSMQALSIVKQLEQDLDIELYPTLLFEYPTINALAGYIKEQITALSTQRIDVVTGVAAINNIAVMENEWLLRPENQSWLDQWVKQYGKDDAQAINRRHQAPYLFLTSAKKGVFYFNQQGHSLLALVYVGPDDYFPELVKALEEYGRENALQVNFILDEEYGAPLQALDYTTTPIGVWHRIPDTQNFTIKGTKMRRLRYQVNAYLKNGECKTERYQVGSQPEKDRELVAIIDDWCLMKGTEAPFVTSLKREILEGSLPTIHQLFVIQCKQRIDAIIIMSPTVRLNGYLMDLEFYRKDMPMGCLEYGITEIMAQLKADGKRFYSLGVTFGTQLIPHENADPKVEKLFASLHQSNMLNGDGNFQFKSKFRPQSSISFLARPKGSSPSNLTELLLMIGDPK